MPGLQMGIDFGTAMLQICVAGKHRRLAEPSVMVCDADTGKPLAIGSSAVEMVGRTPSSLKSVYPLRNGMIDNLEAAQQLLRPYITLLCGNRMFKPSVLFSVPSAATRNEKRAWMSVLTDCGVGRASFIEKPLAAAIGAGEDCVSPGGVLCVEIGAGCTDAALLSVGSVCLSASSRVGGNSMTESIRQYISHARGVEVGFLTAEYIKKQVGCAIRREAEVAVLVNGKEVQTGMPVNIEITSTEVYWVLRSDLKALHETIQQLLENAQNEQIADVMKNGILLTGGGALLYGIDTWLSEQLSMPVRVAEDPQSAVIRGIEKVLQSGGKLFESEYVYLASQSFGEEQK